LAKLTEFTDYAELDWEGTVRRIESLAAEKRRIEQASTELSRLATEIEAAEQLLAELGRTRDGLVSRIGGLETKIDTVRDDLARARETLEEAAREAAREFFDRLADRIDPAPTTPDRYDRAQTAP